jgi:hypothetical protein
MTLCNASPPTRDMRLDDAWNGYKSPRTIHAAGVALRHVVGRQPTAPRLGVLDKDPFLFSVEGERVAEERVKRRGAGTETGSGEVRKVSAACNCNSVR